MLVSVNESAFPFCFCLFLVVYSIVIVSLSKISQCVFCVAKRTVQILLCNSFVLI